MSKLAVSLLRLQSLNFETLLLPAMSGLVEARESAVLDLHPYPHRRAPLHLRHEDGIFPIPNRASPPLKHAARPCG